MYKQFQMATRATKRKMCDAETDTGCDAKRCFRDACTNTDPCADASDSSTDPCDSGMELLEKRLKDHIDKQLDAVTAQLQRQNESNQDGFAKILAICVD